MKFILNIVLSQILSFIFGLSLFWIILGFSKSCIMDEIGIQNNQNSVFFLHFYLPKKESFLALIFHFEIRLNLSIFARFFERLKAKV